MFADEADLSNYSAGPHWLTIAVRIGIYIDAHPFDGYGQAMLANWLSALMSAKR